MAKKVNHIPFLRTHVVGRKGAFTVQFWIGVQGFTIQDCGRSKKASEWLKAVLDIAFKNLENKNKEVFEIYKDLLLKIVEDVKLNPTINAKHRIWLGDLQMEIQIVNGLILER